MKRFQSVCSSCLVIAMIVLTLIAGVPQTAHAAPIGCSTVGCGGGPDNCMSVSLVFRGLSLTVMCYMRVGV